MSAETALLAVSHGTSSPAGAAAVAALVDAVRDRRAADGVAGQVAGGFVDVQQPDVPTSLAALDAVGPGGPPVVVVPLLLAAGYHVHVDLRDDVDAARSAGADVRLAGALGPDGRLVDVLVRRLGEAGLRDDDHVVLAAAGSSDARALGDCETVAAALRERLGDRPGSGRVTLAYVSAARPRVPDAVAAARSRGGRVVVAPFLLAPGYFADLVAAAGGDVTAAPLLVAGGAVPDELVEIVMDRFASFVAA
ncbi:cobalamin (vitamin B12) biosynthesis CbiX protein [Xylanimonas cellulosilytica DSM 15894]|uniref:Cobalamin (Vitamin B12) biosynthesis CbiX protein n=1 Tax=Xylanimonas cellulosilytica (strain DSM 15894 / JCM 12276 / CECT 5975 / KCTC 9989 / LMG 20990 / NBRC 107835 / XIL07) TaxID=446471 RepID=D1BSZ0_XYLCX|nr:CbiX/SirB N-terminal domain-containing protein [Xylanimonas cellulosilytica]ACZ30832.1 cobalamin (vitamin B12) biosynthesis CbiX protein [Xylanimonas cellulosilytica DSM 15894]